MDHQWNMFQQSSFPEKVVMDYNRIVSQNRPNYSSASNSMGYGSYSDYTSNQYQNITKQSPKYNQMSPPDYNNYSNYPTPSQGQNSTNYMQDMSYSTQSSNYYSSGSRSQYSPPPPDFKIGTFTLDSTMTNNTGTSNSQTNSYNDLNGSSANQSMRETGIIEKLLQTYGFIQCCERQARLFFHFSQFDGNTEHLRIGDPVEFEVTFDKRTGKPIASSVTKISPDVVLSEERVIGSVTTELKNESGGEHQGRITYENRGECFFLPYGKDDVEGYVTLKPVDKVSFQIATNQRSGNLGARHIRLENPGMPVKYQGVVSAIKESYGFIERADVVDEIFFHFSEAKSIPDGLKLGDDVEFLIQTHNGKEVATSMVKLSSGTVVFEDVNGEEMKGQVLKPVEKTLKQNQKDPLNGRIRYRGKDRSEVEVKFGERDQRGDFTLKHGDWVKFNIATDRRDRLQKATNISLLDESFYVSGEKREQGVICILKEDFGFIKCADRDCRMHFSYDELLDPQVQLSVGDEVQFTVVSDQTGQSSNRQSAIRIRKLPAGTVKFEVLIQEEMEGEVMSEPRLISKSPTNVTQTEENTQPGIITYTIDNVKQAVNYYPKSGDRGPQVGDRVIFNMYLIKRTKERIATDIKVAMPLITTIIPNPSGSVRQSMVGSGRTFDRGSTNVSTMQTMVANGNCTAETYSANTVSRETSSYTETVLQKTTSTEVPNIGDKSDATQVYANADLSKYSRSFSTNDNRGFVPSDNQNFMPSDNRAFSLKGLRNDAGVNSQSFTGQNTLNFPPNNVRCGSQDLPNDTKSGTQNNTSNMGINNANKDVGNFTADGSRVFNTDTGIINDCQKFVVKESTPIEAQNGKLGEATSKTETSVKIGFSAQMQAPLQRGFVAALKDTFGFVETLHHDKEIFFHFSNVDGDSTNFELGREVEYTISARTGPGGKLSAENVRLLPVGSIPSAKILGEVFEGTVLRPMRAANPDQQDYCGLLCVGKKADGKPLRRHQFGITGLANKKELLQPNDQVSFQLDEDGWAVNICAIRKKLIAVVEAVKGQYGFLNYETEEGKKLFFHQTEVKDGISLSQGDEVEFVIITNQKSGKSSACNITRLATSVNSGPSQRPDRLVSKLKGLALDSSKPRLQIIRQPKGPDGTTGFTLDRRYMGN